MEEVDLGELDSEMLKENIFCAGPLVCGCGDLGLPALFSERALQKGNVGCTSWSFHRRK